MSESLQGWGVAMIVLGAVFIALPFVGLGSPGPPNLGYYLAAGGAALWVIGRILQ